MRTNISKAIEVSGAETWSVKVKFPKRIKHRGRVRATIYGIFPLPPARTKSRSKTWRPAAETLQMRFP
jgi:hypothetical protein